MRVNIFAECENVLIGQRDHKLQNLIEEREVV